VFNLPCCTKKQQGRLNTWLSFGSAQPSKMAQFSVGANTVDRLLDDFLADVATWKGN
jgi:hypothetical protein